jgi:UDP-N-acetylglucosamine transferase subunit ALG13
VIFLTVGYQMPFDRLVKAVDDWASRHTETPACFAQIGPTDYRPSSIPFVDFTEPQEFTDRVRNASVIVAHAGMGSILTALQYGKPIVVMPRRAANRETRNDHQVATAERLRDRPGIHVAMDETELGPILDRLAELREIPPISGEASPELIEHVRRFIAES